MNLIREAMPAAYAAIEATTADPVTFQRPPAAAFATSATLLPATSPEGVKNGNNLRVFMSLSQAGGQPPANGNLVVFAGKSYRVVDVESNDYDGFMLSLRAT